MKHSTKELNIRYFLLQVLFWGAAVVNYAYMTQILQSKGFTSVEIGVLNSAKLLVGVVFQIWLGAFADRTRYTIPLKYLIAVLSAGTGILTIVLYMAGHHFILMLIVSMGFGITFTTLQPLIDSLSMLYCSHGVYINYAKGRMGGSIAWALLCVLAGLYCDWFGLKTFPLCGLFLVLLLASMACFMPWESIRKQNLVSEKRKKARTDQKITTQQEMTVNQTITPHTVSYLLMHYPAFTAFLIGSTVMFMGYNFGTTFLIDIFTGLGGSNTHYGISEFVMAISEVPSAVIILKLRRKIPIQWMMVCCAFFMTLKNLIPTYADNIAVVIAAQACEMLGLGLYYAGSIFFIEENLPQVDIVKGTMLVSVATVGIGEGIAAFICGIIRRQIGLYGLMKTGTFTNALSIIIFLWMCTLKNKESQKLD